VERSGERKRANSKALRTPMLEGKYRPAAETETQFSLMVSSQSTQSTSPGAVHYLIGRVAIQMSSTASAAFSSINTSSSRSSSNVCPLSA